ncbi:hypothetical protein [Agriterribacter sp.]|uniref:hypothetical protein n=1 Tax=Agriterribacter sp. TaxID=2821509 RepID=UPI002CD173BB|nr:hypothetical protein [Agriterribacter sp.]HRO46332.1 hypothetical protein [Agriterribacter sp.]HRQ17499.1 hypothetical protein [Agriterribacter sp.]
MKVLQRQSIRNIILLSVIFCISAGVSAQTNTFPSSGNVGIGTTTPRAKLEVTGNGRFSSSASGSSFIIDISGFPTDNNYSNAQIIAGASGGAGYLKTKLDNWGGYFSWVTNSSSGEREVMKIDATSGNVGIGTSSPQAKLAVNGNIFSQKIKVIASGWPDYVFSPQYRLPGLWEVEDFIKSNGHLPDIPSAVEVEENGLDLGDNQALLLKKIEELTLYIIELNKKVERLEKEK